MPFHTTSSTTILPVWCSRTNVALESGKALAQPRHAVMISSRPSMRRWVAFSSYTASWRNDSLAFCQSLWLGEDRSLGGIDHVVGFNNAHKCFLQDNRGEGFAPAVQNVTSGLFARR